MQEWSWLLRSAVAELLGNKPTEFTAALHSRSSAPVNSVGLFPFHPSLACLLTLILTFPSCQSGAGAHRWYPPAAPCEPVETKLTALHPFFPLQPTR